jgi:hypothetical protein
MNSKGQKIIMGCDVSTKTVGITLLLDDGSEYGQIIELTHISPKVSRKIKGIESLCIKKKIFDEFIKKFKDIGIDEVVIEEPLTSSNNENTVATLLRFNGMLSCSIYEILGIVPQYISSYDARKYSFPDLMAIRKYNKKGKQYDYAKILREIKHSKLVLFGSYSWEVDKKAILQEKVADIFPQIPWIYDKKGELKKENFDATDSYVACYGFLNKLKHGEINFNITNVKEVEDGIEYDVSYWDKTEHRKTFVKK